MEWYLNFLIYTPAGINIIISSIYFLFFILYKKNYSNGIQLFIGFLMSGIVSWFFTKYAFLSQAIVVSIFLNSFMVLMLSQLNILKINQFIVGIYVFCIIASFFILKLDVSSKINGLVFATLIFTTGRRIFQKEYPEFDLFFGIFLCGAGLFFGFSNFVFNLIIFSIVNILNFIFFGITHNNENFNHNFSLLYSISIFITMIIIMYVNVKIPNIINF